MDKINERETNKLLEIFAERCRNIKSDWSGFTCFRVLGDENISLEYIFDVDNKKNNFVVFEWGKDFCYNNFEVAFQHYLLLGFVCENNTRS